MANSAGSPVTRVRRMALALPDASEKLSHGEPANNHHNDGHIAVWIPAAPGMQGC